MQKIPSVKKKKIGGLFFGYGLHLWLMVFLLNVGLYYVAHFYSIGKTCFTTAQVQADTRCLYIWSGKVYEKGTRAAPHHSHPCGTDVTSIIPSDHVANQASYLLPNNVGDICTATVPTNTPVPTKAPTPTPTKVPTPTPTKVPGVTQSPTAVPTQGTGPSVTPIPTQAQTQPTVTTVPTATIVPSPTTAVPLIGAGLSFAFRLSGIGQPTNNFSPAHTTRQIVLSFYSSNATVSNPGTTPLYTVETVATYVNDAQSPQLGAFALSNYDLGALVPAGSYQIAFKTPQSIRTLIKDSDSATTGTIFQLTAGSTAAKQPTVNTVLMGDLNNDNIIDILDYNLLVDCYGGKMTQPTCSAATAVDLNDDSVIDGIDYNIMLRSIQGLIQQGQNPKLQDANQNPSPTTLPTLTPTPIPKVGMDTSKIVLKHTTPTPLPPLPTKPSLSVKPTNAPMPSLFAASNAISLTKIMTYLSLLFLVGISLLGAFKSRIITSLFHRGEKPESKPVAKPEAKPTK